MKYTHTVTATFLKRVNRFVAHVLLEGVETVVHVKNTGRCRELLLPGAAVILEQAGEGSARKTAYSLVAVYKGDRLINMDSQAPNRVAWEAASSGRLPPLGIPRLVKPEAVFGRSRFDLYFETDTAKGFVEVKGVTLEEDGIVRFPDAPTTRGAKHVLEMIEAVEAGYEGYLLFVIQMKGAVRFEPNEQTDPAFAAALRLAASRGVQLLAYDCIVTEDTLELGEPVEIRL